MARVATIVGIATIAALTLGPVALCLAAALTGRCP